MKFPSAVDTWFYILVLGVPFVVIVPSVALSETLTISAMVIVGFSILVAVVLPVWLLFSTHYTVKAGVLVVRSGPLKWSVPLSDIKSVHPTRSVLSSPALSLDRLEIRYGHGKSVLVSPKDKEGFKNALGSF